MRRWRREVVEDDPCCSLYREPYLIDHEYGCPARVARAHKLNTDANWRG